MVRDKDGKFVKGHPGITALGVNVGKHNSPETEFKKGQKPWNAGQHKEILGYSGLHKFIRETLGRTTTCEMCGKSELSRQKIHWANKSGQYKKTFDDWMRLCVKCHRKYDRERRVMAYG